MRALVTESALHVSVAPDKPGVRIQIELGGKLGDWMEFETPEQAWACVDLLTKTTEAAFGPRG